MKVYYQSRHFKCKMFTDRSITARWKSTQANSVQLVTPLASPGLTEEHRVPALLLTAYLVQRLTCLGDNPQMCFSRAFESAEILTFELTH